MSPIFNTAVTAFLPRASVQELVVAVAIHSNLEHQKIKVSIVSNFYPSICHGFMEPDAMILVF